MEETDPPTAPQTPWRDRYLPNVLLLHLMALDHYLPLEEAAVSVVVQSLLGEQVGFLFSLRVLEVFFMLRYPLLLLLLGCAMVLIQFLKTMTETYPGPSDWTAVVKSWRQ